MFSNEAHCKDPQACIVSKNYNREQILKARCTTGTQLGSLHRPSRFILTAAACRVGVMNRTLVFGDKGIDDIQILLIILITYLASGYMLSL